MKEVGEYRRWWERRQGSYGDVRIELQAVTDCFSYAQQVAVVSSSSTVDIFWLTDFDIDLSAGRSGL